MNHLSLILKELAFLLMYVVALTMTVELYRKRVIPIDMYIPCAIFESLVYL